METPGRKVGPGVLQSCVKFHSVEHSQSSRAENFWLAQDCQRIGMLPADHTALIDTWQVVEE